MKEGYTKVRNKEIANAFTHMKIIKRWGSGIPQIFKEFKEPELIDMDGNFRANIYRKHVQIKKNKLPNLPS